jgi:hypothetical protein
MPMFIDTKEKYKIFIKSKDDNRKTDLAFHGTSKQLACHASGRRPSVQEFYKAVQALETKLLLFSKQV